MKTTNIPGNERPGQTWTFLKPVSLALISIATAVTFSACGKKDSGSAVVVPPANVGIYGGIGCPTCSATNQQFLDSAIGHVNSYSLGVLEAELILEFYGSGIQGASTMNQTYSGSVEAKGLMDIKVASTACMFPVGLYSLRTIRAGQWGGGGQSFARMELEGTSPAGVIRIAFDDVGAWVNRAIPAARSVTIDQNRQFPYRLNGRVWVRGINSGNWCPMPLE